MKKRTKETINLLCYIGIFILIGIIVLPPLLRFLLPDSDSFENKVTLNLLTCQKTEAITNTKKEVKTHYKNGKVVKIKITYTNVLETSEIDEKDFYHISGVEADEKEEKLDITIIPNNNNKERLNTLFQPLEKQKSIYEDGDYHYICHITTE